MGNPVNLVDRIVELRRVRGSDLIKNELNYRTHPAAQRSALAGVLEKVGIAAALIARETPEGLLLIDGHLRAEDYGDQDWPVLILDVDEAEARLLLASLDPLAEMAEHDNELLEQLLDELTEEEQDLVGFLYEEEKLVDGLTDPDQVPERPAVAITKPGDLWLLGDHRLLCGDATKLDDLGRLMNGELAQLCFTSPPYWVGKSYETQTTLEEILDFANACSRVMAAAVTRDGGRIVINTSTAMATAINPSADAETLFALAWWQDALRAEGWLMRHCRLWVKRGQLAAPHVAARSDVVDQHWETVATFLPTFYCPDGLRRGQEKIGVAWAQQGVWDDIHGSANMKQHGAAFPVELPSRYLQLYSVDAELIFEPFCGTGTTIIAAQQLGRRCYSLELDPLYCDAIVDRWEQFTGLKAQLAS